MTVSDFFQVDESMENVEYVVRERNRAYFELETGVSGEAERRIQTGPFGLPVGYTPKVKSPEKPPFLEELKQVFFQQTHNQGLRQLFLTVSWNLQGLAQPILWCPCMKSWTQFWLDP